MIVPPWMSAVAMAYKLESTLEFYSCSDTCVLGSHALIFQYSRSPVQVFVYDPDMGDETYRTVSEEMAYDHPHIFETFF